MVGTLLGSPSESVTVAGSGNSGISKFLVKLMSIKKTNLALVEKAKWARSSESLPTGLLCNQYNPECDGKSAIRIRAKFRGYLKKNNRELMKKFLSRLS